MSVRRALTCKLSAVLSVETLYPPGFILYTSMPTIALGTGRGEVKEKSSLNLKKVGEFSLNTVLLSIQAENHFHSNLPHSLSRLNYVFWKEI